jgi:glycosyltransferase involved in cell wall biosynthesis
MMMKVLAISSTGRLGGAELALAEFLKHRPLDVQVSVLMMSDGPLADRLAQSGVETSVAGEFEGRPSLRQAARFTQSLRGLLRREPPDVVLAVGILPACLSVPAARLTGVPIVWHKVDFSHDATVAVPLAGAVNGVVSVSSAAAAALGPLRSRRLLDVVGPPIRLPDEGQRERAPDPPAIGTLAALTPYKGQHHIIEAAAQISAEFPRLRVVLAGDTVREHPGYRDQLVRLAERLGLAERVEFTGFVDDVAGVLDRLTVYVSATHRDAQGFGLEGLSGAMLEASWVGLPVVATRGGGTPEGLQDGVTGTLVDPADPAGLARALARYLRDPELARSTGEAGRRFARERFAPEVTVAGLFGALARVVRVRGAG